MPDLRKVRDGLSREDRDHYDRMGDEGPFAHVTSSARPRKVDSRVEPAEEPDSHAIIRWHGDGGRHDD